jgi:hypothetical protein
MIERIDSVGNIEYESGMNYKLNTNTMKRILFLLILLTMVTSAKVMSQPTARDFVIVGMVSDDLNLIQIQMRYDGAPNAYSIRDSSINGVEQIANAIDGMKISDLHLFVKINGKELFLTGAPISIENVNDFKEQLGRWKSSVSGKVIVHTGSSTSSPEINDLLIKMGEMTGLEWKQLR